MRFMVLLLSANLLLAGCLDDSDGGDTDAPDDTDGGDGGAGGGAGGNVSASPAVILSVSLSGAYPATIAYEPATLTVEAGDVVTLRFTNDDVNPLPSHDWALEGFEDTAQTDVIANGETVEITFTAPTEPGEYAFYCSVPGHRGNGMEGTFVVT